MCDDHEKNIEPRIEDEIFDDLKKLFKKQYKPTDQKEGVVLLTTQAITDKFADILPGVNDSQILKALRGLGFKATMLKTSTGFDLYWMLKEK